MIMKKTSLFLIVFLFAISHITRAQLGYQAGSYLYVLDETIKRLDKRVDYQDVVSYKGTPYYNVSFLLGEIYQNNKLIANNIALRYNVASDEFEVKESLTTENSKARVLTKSSDVFVKINKTIFIFALYNGSIEEGSYFQVLFEGEKYNFYKKLIKKLTPAKKAKTSITTDTPAIFTDKIIYFIVTKDGKYYEFPSNKNKKIKVFGSKKETIKKYIKENKLNLNKEEDLKKTIQYFDSLENSKD
ncbi:MAG: hypothetical protein COB12_04850 [Flavobacterium sp.]|nr:MAG: hypothetical protein COB12_04850 [Flavobacterium sp.]